MPCREPFCTGRPFGNGFGQSAQNLVFESCLKKLLAYFLGKLGQLPAEVIDSVNQDLWIEPQLGRHFLPVVEADIAKEMLAPDLHCQFGLLQIHVGVGQDAGEVIKRGEADVSARTNENAVVFRVRVGSGDEPVKGDCVEKGLNIRRRGTGIVAEQSDNLHRSGPAFILLWVVGASFQI